MNVVEMQFLVVALRVKRVLKNMFEQKRVKRRNDIKTQSYLLNNDYNCNNYSQSPTFHIIIDERFWPDSNVII